MAFIAFMASQGKLSMRRAISQLLSACIAIIAISFMMQPASGQNSAYSVFLPSISADQVTQEPTAEPTAQPTEIPTATPVPPSAATLNTQELQMEALFRGHPGQRRPSMLLNPILSQAARQKAEDMGQRDYFAHVNPDGHGPNFLVQQAGYKLPSFYDQSPSGNNIESIAAGYDSAQAMWDYWLTSAGHRTHLLGEQSFYQEQIEYGIGYAYVPNSRYQHYWVVFSSKPAQ